jgi:hypothetical protein
LPCLRLNASTGAESEIYGCDEAAMTVCERRGKSVIPGTSGLLNDG